MGLLTHPAVRSTGFGVFKLPWNCLGCVCFVCNACVALQCISVHGSAVDTYRDDALGLLQLANLSCARRELQRMGVQLASAVLLNAQPVPYVHSFYCFKQLLVKVEMQTGQRLDGFLLLAPCQVRGSIVTYAFACPSHE